MIPPQPVPPSGLCGPGEEIDTDMGEIQLIEPSVYLQKKLVSLCLYLFGMLELTCIKVVYIITVHVIALCSIIITLG